MNKKIYTLIATISLLLSLVIAFDFKIMQAKASEAERAMSTQNKPQPLSIRVTCEVNYLLLHKAQLQRMDFALSDGRGNALGLRSGNRLVSQEPCDLNLRRLDFALSDGRGNALGLRSVNPVMNEVINDFNLQRLDFAWSDGKGNALDLRNEPSTGLGTLDGLTLKRLDFAWSDGRGNALGLRK